MRGGRRFGRLAGRHIVHRLDCRTGLIVPRVSGNKVVDPTVALAYTLQFSCAKEMKRLESSKSIAP